MQYFGGKQRIAGKIVDILTPVVERRGNYVEPFVGGAAVLARITATTRYASDSNRALITMWKALAGGWCPPETVSEETYRAVKLANNPDDPLTAFVGFGVSFSGKWFGGYARSNVDRNYAANAVSSLRKKLQGLAGVNWYFCDYRECPIPKNAVIYCDPPYAGTTQYGAVDKFEWEQFWEWCIKKNNEGCAVFVSEYNAPQTFRPCLTIQTRTDIRTAANGKETRTEKLFVPVGNEYA